MYLDSPCIADLVLEEEDQVFFSSSEDESNDDLHVSLFSIAMYILITGAACTIAV